MQEALPVTNGLQLAPSRSVRRVNQEIFFQPTIYAHLVHAVCVEALIAGSSGNSLTWMVIANPMRYRSSFWSSTGAGNGAPQGSMASFYGASGGPGTVKIQWLIFPI